MKDKNDLAESRTDWAEDRTILANERTFAGWMRTGMACVGVAKAVASVFIIAALYVYWAAQASAAKTQKRLSDHHANAQPNSRMKILAAILAVASTGVGAILWML